MNRALLPLTAAALAVAVVGTTAPALGASGPASPVRAAADTTAWDEAAASLFASPYSDGLTALYVAVYRPRTGWTYKAYGEAAPGVPATLKDHFPIGSITKTVLATSVLQHVEAGDLSLDDTVRKLDPALAKQFPQTARWTVRQLLSMSTTLPDYADPSLAHLVADPAKKFAREQLIEIGLAEGAEVPEGGAYSTTNYIVLGDIMMAVTGKSPARLVNDVFAQLKMKESRLTALGTRPAPATHGYVGAAYGMQTEKENPAVTATTDVTTQNGEWYLTWGREGGGAYSTTADLGRWAKSCVGNSLLDKATVAEREKTHAINVGAYGLGIINEGAYWGHGGQVIGYEALATCNPKTGEAIALAVNTSSSLGSAIAVFGKAAFPQYVKAWLKEQFS